jgi:hypothetical protein
VEVFAIRDHSVPIVRNVVVTIKFLNVLYEKLNLPTSRKRTVVSNQSPNCLEKQKMLENWHINQAKMNVSVT